MKLKLNIQFELKVNCTDDGTGGTKAAPTF